MKINNIVIKDNKKYKVRKIIGEEYIQAELIEPKQEIHYLVDITYYLKRKEVELIDNTIE